MDEPDIRRYMPITQKGAGEGFIRSFSLRTCTHRIYHFHFVTLASTPPVPTALRELSRLCEHHV